MQDPEDYVSSSTSSSTRSPVAVRRRRPAQDTAEHAAQKADKMRDDYCSQDITDEEKEDILDDMNRLLNKNSSESIIGAWPDELRISFADELAKAATSTILSERHRRDAIYMLGDFICSRITGDAMEGLLRALITYDMNEETAVWEKGDGADEEKEYIVGRYDLPIDYIVKEYRNNDIDCDMLTVAAPMLTSGDWSTRVAGMRGVAAAVSYGGQRFGEKLLALINLVEPMMSDPHPRVRNYACLVMKMKAQAWMNDKGRNGLDGSLDGWHDESIDRVIPALILLLADPVDRVAALAAATLDVFFSPDPLLEEYDPIAASVLAHSSATMSELDRCVQANVQRMIKEKKLKSLSKLICLIETVGKAQRSLLEEYYERLVGPIKLILQEIPAASNDRAAVKLARIAIACMTQFGESVTPSRYKRDAIEVAAFVSSTIDTDPFYELLHTEGFANDVARCASILGKLFIPHLDQIVRAIINALTPSLDERRCSCQVKHDAREEVQLLLSLADEFVDYIGPYVEKLNTLAHEARQNPNMYTYVDLWGYTIAPRLVESLLLKGDSAGAHALWQELYSALKELINADFDKECIGAALVCIASGLTQIGSTGVSVGMMDEMGGLLRGIMDDYEKNRSTSDNVHEAFQGVHLLKGVTQLLHAASKIGFDSLLPADCHKMIGQYLLDFTRDGEPALRWPAAFALGTLALAKSPVYDKEFIGTALKCLLTLVRAAFKPTETEDLQYVTGAAENGLSSSLKIAQSFTIEKDQIERLHHMIGNYLARFGVKEDLTEYEMIYGQFAALVEEGNRILLGDKSNVLAILVKALHNDVISEVRKSSCALKSRLLALVKIIALDDQAVAKAALTADEQETMRRIINDL